jgi:peptidoglycan L-alanyl-D-glutamate endopeptidase CwlK
MTYAFGSRSRDALATCHRDLQAIAREAIQLTDFSVLEGHRGEDRQNALVEAGKSWTRWPHGKHNASPSLAFDFSPYPVDWNDLSRFTYLSGVMIGIGHGMGIRLRYGGDWNSNGDLMDENPETRDWGHIELVR